MDLPLTFDIRGDYVFQHTSSLTQKLIYRAFALSNPTSELLTFIELDPTYDTVARILSCYIEMAHKDPYCAKDLAMSLSNVSRSESVQSIRINGYYSIGGVFNEELVGYHSDGFVLNKDNETFGPTNTYLIASLLSGLSLKHNLTCFSDQFTTIEDGLNIIDNTLPNSEVLVIGTCIQLLTAGSEIVQIPGLSESYLQLIQSAARKLETQKSLGTVKNCNALEVLEVGQLLMQYES
jgi:hypothetical protein